MVGSTDRPHRLDLYVVALEADSAPNRVVRGSIPRRRAALSRAPWRTIWPRGQARFENGARRKAWGSSPPVSAANAMGAFAKWSCVSSRSAGLLQSEVLLERHPVRIREAEGSTPSTLTTVWIREAVGASRVWQARPDSLLDTCSSADCVRYATHVSSSNRLPPL